MTSERTSPQPAGTGQGQQNGSSSTSDSTGPGTSHLASAIGYAKRGWPVLPLHNVIDDRCSCWRPDCGSSGKHPRTEHGVKDATTDLPQIVEWWKKWPKANIGIATGKASGLVIIDVDPRNGGDDSFDALEEQHGGFPDTVVCSTGGGGTHRYYRYPSGGVELPGKLAEGIDLKSDGGYVVAPPSNHVDGGTYWYDFDSTPENTGIAPLPEWIITKATTAENSGTTTQLTSLDPAAILNGVPVGERNDTVYRYCCRLRGKNLDWAEAVSLVRTIVDKSPQDPPFTLREAMNCLISAWEHAADEAKPEADGTMKPPPARVEVRPVIDVFSNPPAPVEPLVRDLILPGDRVVIGGARGTAKTWLGMGMALLLSRGEGWLFERFEIMRPVRVIYAHGELLDDETTYQRWRKLVAEGTIPAELLESFSSWNVRPVKRRKSFNNGVFTSTEEWTDARIDGHFIDAIEEYEPEVMVLDPWRLFFAGEENSNTEVQAALAQLDRLADEYGLTLIFIHHFSQSRAGSDPEDWWRGASRLGDWASVRITLEPYFKRRQDWEREGMNRHQARQCVTLRLLLRRQETPDEFGVRFDPQTGLWVPWNGPIGTSGQRKHVDPDEVVRRMREDGGEWRSTKVAAEALGVSQEVAKRILKEAERAGKVERFPGPRGAIGWRPAETQVALPVVSEEDDDHGD